MTKTRKAQRRGLVRSKRSTALALLRAALGSRFGFMERWPVGTTMGEVKLDVVVTIAATRAPIAAFKMRKSPREDSIRNQKYDAALIPWRQFDPATVKDDADWVRSLIA